MILKNVRIDAGHSSSITIEELVLDRLELMWVDVGGVVVQIKNAMNPPRAKKKADDPYPGRRYCTAAEIDLARNRGKIAAIKAYRERTGSGLADSKDAVESDMHFLGYSFHRGY